MTTIFITGTDTEIGKTYTTLLMMKNLKRLGYRVLGLKPIASGGCYNQSGDFVNDDGIMLQAASSISLPYSHINPILLSEPISPHLASKIDTLDLSVEYVLKVISDLHAPESDFYLIEGCGGWDVPINDDACYSDVVKALRLPVILVVGIKLGCFNHALLTVKSIRHTGCPLIGWVANIVDTTLPKSGELIDSLRRWLDIPFLGVIPREPQPNHGACLDLNPLISYKAHELVDFL